MIDRRISPYDWRQEFSFQMYRTDCNELHHMSLWAWASSTGNFDLDGFDLVDYRNQFAPVTTAEGLVVEAGGIQYTHPTFVFGLVLIQKIGVCTSWELASRELRLQLIRHWYKLYFLLALAHSTW